MAEVSDARTILIVDDEPSVREVLVAFFQHEYVPRGYVLETAADGAEAVAAVLRRRPALVLLDVEMPGLNGIAALRAIRAFDSTIPVIMVTGNDSSRVAGQLIQDGAFSYLPKPVKLRYLEHLVAAALR